MAFVNERTNKVIDGKLYTDWIIDRDRNAFVIDIDGYSDVHTRIFQLHWNGNIISFQGIYSSMKSKSDHNYDIYYTVPHIGIPENLKTEEYVIKEMISEALKEYGLLGRKKYVASVSTSFSR